MTYVSFSCLLWDSSRCLLALLVFSWVLKTISCVLPGLFESCPDLPALTVGPLGAPIPICTCNLHIACLSIFHAMGLGLGAPCCLVLGVVCSAWLVWDFAHCIARLWDALTPSCARKMHVPCLKIIPVAHFGVRALYCFEVVVAGCWLCYFGPRPAVGLPRSFRVASQALFGPLNPFGLVRRLSRRS